MNRRARTAQAVAGNSLPFHGNDQVFEEKNSVGLTDILLAIQEKRGALYMAKCPVCQLKAGIFSPDHLHAQNAETLDLVARLLRKRP
jgi:hypothetical protein